MPGRVARHVDDAKADAQRLHFIATVQRGEGLGDALARRAEHLRASGSPQFGHAAGVIAVVVRD